MIHKNNFRSIVIAAIFIQYFSFRLLADSVTVSGNVSGLWDVDTVRVIGNIKVKDTQSLTIQPGVLVEFYGFYFFEISGVIHASGNEDHPIIFTRSDTTGFYNDTLPDGGWNGIRFNNQSPDIDSSFFEHCIFQYGKAVAADSVSKYGGAMCIRDFDKMVISKCTFRNNFAWYNGGALYLKAANILLSECEFYQNRAGLAVTPYGYGGAVCTDWGEPVIINNSFTNNSSTGIAGGLCIRFTDCPVYLNVFTGNFSALGGAIGILHIPQCLHTINNNLIAGNACVFFGGGVSNNNASPTWINNTIVENTSYSYGGGFYGNDSICPNVYNTIIWGNQAPSGNQVYLWATTSQANFYHCDIQGGPAEFAGSGGVAFTGDYLNNLDTLPGFTMLQPFPYQLGVGSPCINTGTPDTTGLMLPATDLAGENRIVNGRIDIGAYEYQGSVNINKTTIELQDAVLYDPIPNPASVGVTFRFFLMQESKPVIRITGIGGNLIKEITVGKLDFGSHELPWDLTDDQGNPLSNGIYITSLIIGQRSFSKRLIISR